MMICYWRFVFAFMTFTGLVLVYMLRVNISVAIVAMVNSTDHISANYTPECPVKIVNGSDNSRKVTGEFNWSEGEQTTILSSFYWGYTIMQLPSGFLLLFFKPKWIYGLSTLLTSILTFLIPVAATHGVYPTVTLRFLMGICEGPTFPALYTLCGFWILPKENSIVSTFIVSGSTIGTIVGQSLMGLLIDLYGWRLSFYIMATFGCVWFLVYMIVIHDRPDLHPFISDSEQKQLTESRSLTKPDRKSKKMNIPWKEVFTSRPYLGYMVFTICFNFTWYTMINCLPLYIGKVLGFNIAQNGAISSVPYIALLIFSLSGGMLQDFIKSLNIISTTKIRKIFGFFGMVSCSVIMYNILFTGCNIPLTIALVCISISLLGFSGSVNCVNLLDLAPEFAGPLMAVVNFFNSICGIIAPYIKDFFTRTGETRSNWTNVFITNSSILFFGAIVYVLFGSASIQPWAIETKSYTVLVGDSESFDSQSETRSDIISHNREATIQ